MSRRRSRCGPFYEFMHRRAKDPLAVLHVVMAELFTNIRHTYVPDTALGGVAWFADHVRASLTRASLNLVAVFVNFTYSTYTCIGSSTAAGRKDLRSSWYRCPCGTCSFIIGQAAFQDRLAYEHRPNTRWKSHFPALVTRTARQKWNIPSSRLFPLSPNGPLQHVNGWTGTATG